jgi:hypothetical protein
MLPSRLRLACPSQLEPRSRILASTVWTIGPTEGRRHPLAHGPSHGPDKRFLEFVAEFAGILYSVTHLNAGELDSDVLCFPTSKYAILVKSP